MALANPPSLVEHRVEQLELRFLIFDAPTDANLPYYLNVSAFQRIYYELCIPWILFRIFLRACFSHPNPHVIFCSFRSSKDKM